MRILALIGTVLVGLFFLFFGLVGVALEYQTPPAHTVHVALFMGSSVLGALILPGIGTIVLAAAKSGLAVAGPYLPSFGRRAYDNPPPPEPPHAS